VAGHGLGEKASETLLARKEALALAVTGALYAERPELLDRFGESGRQKCLQDMRYNIEHLAPAVALGEPAMFTRYVVWLRDLLEARGVPSGEVVRSLELLSRALDDDLHPDEASTVRKVIDAGLAAVAGAPE